MAETSEKSDANWEACLTSEQYGILRKKGTELPFTGKYLHNQEIGMYLCAACGNELFHSGAKFDSKTGWPSFWQPKSAKAVEEKADVGLGMKRTEVVCGRCGGHLGHVFEDGPKPTGLRYCINSGALNFRKDGEKEGNLK